MNSRRFLFVSDNDAWGGSEELWARAAVNLAADGHHVAAAVPAGKCLHPRVLDLKTRGLSVDTYPKPRSVWQRLRAKIVPRKPGGLAEAAFTELIRRECPALVIFSSGSAYPNLNLTDACVAEKVPFATIGQANSPSWWPYDEWADALRRCMTAAARCYFVSDDNLALAQRQLGCSLANARVVRNPFNVSYEASPPWPDQAPDGAVRFACVARLDPRAKGQDILFEVLARPQWKQRAWTLSLYGEGDWERGLRRLADYLGIGERVQFVGHVANVEAIWSDNHLLVLPSRHEGMPLAAVEAMLCARPVVATAVAGNPEVIEDNVSGFLAGAANPESLAEALERFWLRRSEAKAIGAAAARRVRALIPRDPARIFADDLATLVSQPSPLARSPA